MRTKIWAYVTSFGYEVSRSNTLFQICFEDGHEVRFIVDCGIQQGTIDASQYGNGKEFEYDVTKLDFALLTHFHADHVGRMPYLVKKGFSGKIYTTSQTIQMSEVILYDEIKCMANDFAMNMNKWKCRNNYYASSDYKRYYTESNNGRPFILYGSLECEETLKRMEKVEYDTPFSPCDGIEITFCPNGHVLGSACILVRAMYKGEKLTFFITGDIASQNKITNLVTYVKPAWRNWVDCIISEATYGASPKVRDYNVEVAKHIEILSDVLENNKTLIYIVNAIERPEVVLTDLAEIISRQMLGTTNTAKLVDTPVYFDSSMGRDGLELYNKILGERAKYIQPKLLSKDTRDTVWNDLPRRKIYLMTSPQFVYGSFTTYADKVLENENVNVVFCSYVKDSVANIINATRGTKIKYLENDYIKKCQMYQLQHYSSHASMRELQIFLDKFSNANTILFQHGSVAAKENAAKMFANERRNTYVMQYGNTFRINNTGMTKIY